MPSIDVQETSALDRCEACLCAAAPNSALGDRTEAIQRAFCIGVAIALVQGPTEEKLLFCKKHYEAMARLIAVCKAVGRRPEKDSA